MQLVDGLLPWWPGFVLGSGHVRFVVDKVALGQVFPCVLQFFPVSIIPLSLSICIGGCSSETSSHPIGMNNMNKLDALVSSRIVKVSNTWSVQ
jgi:hypothetical protein